MNRNPLKKKNNTNMQKYKSNTKCLIGENSVLLVLEKDVATELNIQNHDWLEYEIRNKHLILKKLDDKYIHLIEKDDSDVLSKYSEFDEDVDLSPQISTSFD